MRLDKWIWYSWMVKSRTQAIEACRKGNVKVNGVVCKPAKEISIGDKIEVVLPKISRVFEVVEFIRSRGKQENALSAYNVISITEKETEEQKKENSRAKKVRNRYGDNRESKKDKRRRKQFLNS